MDQSAYATLRFGRPAAGVLEIVLDNPETLNSVTAAGHGELTRVWRDISDDADVRAVLIRGEGRGFSAGGDFDLVESIIDDAATRARVLREARDLVYNVIECTKPIVAAIHGPAVGAGLAVALLADIPIAARSARILDGHTTLGVAAGDHSAIIWPLAIGMAKAKYHLMLNEPLSGEEAERIGLVAKVVDDDALYDEALDVATRLAAGSTTALSWTKLALGNWLRIFGPTFDASLALEFLGFTGPDAREGLAAIREKRRPEFE